MNKNRYRIIFNKARGMLMVVADIAASGRATSSPSSGPGHTLTQRLCSLSGLSFSLGNNLSVSATGSDIHVQGSGLQAGNDLSLSAQRDVLLDSALNTRRLDGKNESHGSSVGVGINFGQGANGLSVSVSASGSKGKGHERGNGTTHSQTTLDAGNHLSIVSGRDTALTGAQVSGSQVSMDVGRNLTLASEQDSDNYDSKQTSVSGGLSGSMAGGSASVNLSRDKMHSTYDSVIEQTGIFAGQGGFDITVGEHTQLDGAVIGSTADVTRNRLDTGTLGFGDGGTSNWLKGDDPLTGGAISGLGAGLGHGIGSKLIKPGLDKFINPNWKNWEWVDVGMGISKPMPLNPLPGVLGTAGGGTFTEIFNDQAGKGMEKLKKDVK